MSIEYSRILVLRVTKLGRSNPTARASWSEAEEVTGKQRGGLLLALDTGRSRRAPRSAPRENRGLRFRRRKRTIPAWRGGRGSRSPRPLAQDLGVRNDPVLALEVDRVADLQDRADVVRRFVSAILEADAVALAADDPWTCTRATDPRPWEQARERGARAAWKARAVQWSPASRASSARSGRCGKRASLPGDVPGSADPEPEFLCAQGVL